MEEGRKLKKKREKHFELQEIVMNIFFFAIL